MMSSVNDQVSILYKKFSSWRMVGAELAWEAADRGIIDGVDGHTNRYAALANAVYRGAAKDSPTLRAALGMAAVTTEPVAVCEDCGHVHTRLKQCEGERQTRTRHRVALEVDTPDEAAALRALLARYGTRREVGRKLVSGELMIRKGDSDDN